ncbi:response regulator [Thalassospira sp. MA62]|nr:response regulator [Thalassospira sp. MA62]
MKLAVANQGYEEMSDIKPVKLLICDDSVFMRMAVRALCEVHPGIDIVGEAEDGEDAISAAAELKPDVITMDLSMPGMDGVAATQAIARQNKTSIIVLSSLTEQRSALAERLMEIGAVDAIWKSASLMDIDIDGIATTILEKILFWGSHHENYDQFVQAPPSAPTAPIQERIDALASQQDKATVISLGAGSMDSLETLLGDLHDKSAPVILVPNVPKSCRDGVLRAIDRATQRPVLMASDGVSIDAGHVYCVFQTSDLLIQKKAEGPCFTAMAQSLQDEEQHLLVLYKSLIASQITPACLVLSGSRTNACKHLHASAKDAFIVAEAPSSCPHPEATEYLVTITSDDIATDIPTLRNIVGQL